MRLGYALIIGIALTAGQAVAESRPPSAFMPRSFNVAESSVIAPPVGGSVASPEYVLDTGDEIQVTVYGEEDLSGQYLVGSTGVVALPLIGDVEAARRTLREFEGVVRTRLAAGYLKDPRVSVQVLRYRPFFILGEVSKPGGYPYVNGMTVLNAVALAGGYTYRADRGDIRIVYANDPNKAEQDINEDASVAPGDIIRVPERFF